MSPSFVSIKSAAVVIIFILESVVANGQDIYAVGCPQWPCAFLYVIFLHSGPLQSTSTFVARRCARSAGREDRVLVPWAFFIFYLVCCTSLVCCNCKVIVTLRDITTEWALAINIDFCGTELRALGRPGNHRSKSYLNPACPFFFPAWRIFRSSRFCGNRVISLVSDIKYYIRFWRAQRCLWSFIWARSIIRQWIAVAAKRQPEMAPLHLHKT